MTARGAADGVVTTADVPVIRDDQRRVGVDDDDEAFAIRVDVVPRVQATRGRCLGRDTIV